MPGDRTWWAHRSLIAALRPHHLETLRLALTQDDLDLVVLGFSLKEAPQADQLAAVPPERHLVVRGGARDALLGGGPPAAAPRARLIRMLPEVAGELITRDLSLPFAGIELEWEGPQAVAHPAPAPVDSPHPAKDGGWVKVTAGLGEPRPFRRSGRPVVFVLPVFMVVGGVERNTIEVMRRLRHVYDFVVITTERASEAQGSLHQGFVEQAIGVYEIGEIARQDGFLALLGRLRDHYRPELVWICNGSPWQCHFSLQIRQIFSEVAIVDQTVYDTKVGWIEWYREPGIQAYDHYIACSDAIRIKLLNDIGLEPGRVSLIYPTTCSERFAPEVVTEARRTAFRERFGLNGHKPLLLWLGRLHPQKRPLRFVELARGLVRKGFDGRFLMFGDGPLRESIVEQLRSRPVSGLSWEPFIEDVPEALACASGLVMTSSFEGLPVVMIEALSMGVPVLATDVSDIGRVLQRTGCGEVYPVRASSRRLVEIALRWLERREEYVQAARGAAPMLQEMFNSDAIAGQYRECFDPLIAGQGRRRS